MYKKFLCKYCNYFTDRRYSYNKHLTSKKHIFNYNIESSKNDEIIKNEENILTNNNAISINNISIKNDENILTNNQNIIINNEHITNDNDNILTNNQDMIINNENRLKNNIVIIDNGIIDKEELVDDIKCMYCNTPITDPSNKSRHYKLCKVKQIKTELQVMFNKEKEELEKKYNEEKKELEKNYKDIQTEYFELIKKISNNEIGSNNNNINTYNTCYVINNYKDAYNYDEIMEKSLTDEEKKYLHENGPLCACLNIILTRCIEKLELEKRPFHCVDQSRQKILLRNNNEWNIDNKAQEIIKKCYNLLCDEWNITDINIDPYKYVEDCQKLASVVIDNNLSKTISEKSFLKNNKLNI